MSGDPPVEVVLLQLPRLLSDILRDLVDGEEGMHVLAEVAAARDILAPARSARGRVVVLTAGDAPGADLLALLPELPHARALAVSVDGRRAVLCALEPRCNALRETSAEEIIRAIRYERRPTAL